MSKPAATSGVVATYKGTATYATYPTSPGRSPGTMNDQENLWMPDVNMDQIAIKWTEPDAWAESNLTGMTLADLAENSDFSVEIINTVTLTGEQDSTSGGVPTMKITYYNSSTDPNTPQQTVKYQSSYDGTKPNEKHPNDYIINNVPVANFPYAVIAVNMYPDAGTGAIAHDANSMSLTIIANVTLTITCRGTSLDDATCSSFCSVTDHLEACLQPMMDYCFSASSGPVREPIGASTSCQNFFADYTRGNGPGPTSAIDDSLSSYCGVYPNLGSLFDTTGVSAADQELCACHLEPAVYVDYYNQLFQVYPGLGAPVSGTVFPCYLPQCGSSRYPSVTTTKVCPVPQCVNVVTFDAEGNIVDSNIDINQSAECQQVATDTPCSDTASCPTGTNCSPSTGYCIVPCTTDTDCAGKPAPHCDTTQGACVVCTKDDQCAQGQICVSGNCSAGARCTSDADCKNSSAPHCNSGGSCVACISDNQCGTDQTCDNGVCVAAQPKCKSDDDCLSGYQCDTNSGDCVAQTGLAPWAWALIILAIIVVVILIVVLIMKARK